MYDVTAFRQWLAKLIIQNAHLNAKHAPRYTALNLNHITSSVSAMPYPMRPFLGVTKYASSFAQPDGICWNNASSRSLDDSAVDVINKAHKQQQMASLTSQATYAGGTLPRPKGLVRPVAKITANAREDSLPESGWKLDRKKDVSHPHPVYLVLL
jgi:hypothetical protein